MFLCKRKTATEPLLSSAFLPSGCLWTYPGLDDWSIRCPFLFSKRLSVFRRRTYTREALPGSWLFLWIMTYFENRLPQSRAPLLKIPGADSAVQQVRQTNAAEASMHQDDCRRAVLHPSAMGSRCRPMWATWWARGCRGSDAAIN